MDAPLDSATEALILALPKISLHNHLIGAVSAGTVLDLARKHGVIVEGGRDADTLYDHESYEDLNEFLRVLDVAGSVMRDADDFRRVAFETLTDGGAALGVVHREIFLSPPGHPGVPYRTIIEGVRRRACARPRRRPASPAAWWSASTATTRPPQLSS